MQKNRITVSGKVQGVGFRYMTKIVADKLGVYGTVKNEDDGSVTIEAIAPDDIMAEFIQQVKNSPSPSGKVTHCTVSADESIKDSIKFKVTN